MFRNIVNAIVDHHGQYTIFISVPGSYPKGRSCPQLRIEISKIDTRGIIFHLGCSGTDHFCILYYTTIYNSFKSIIPPFFVNTHTIVIHTDSLHSVMLCRVTQRH